MTQLLLGLTVLAAGLAAQSQTPKPVPAPPQGTPEINEDKPEWSRKPFDRLFQERLRELEKHQTTPQLEWKGDAIRTPEPTIECGIIVMRPDRPVDSGMIIRAPENHGSKIRTIPLPECR